MPGVNSEKERFSKKGTLFTASSGIRHLPFHDCHNNVQFWAQNSIDVTVKLHTMNTSSFLCSFGLLHLLLVGFVSTPTQKDASTGVAWCSSTVVLQVLFLKKVHLVIPVHCRFNNGTLIVADNKNESFSVWFLWFLKVQNTMQIHSSGLLLTFPIALRESSEIFWNIVKLGP